MSSSLFFDGERTRPTDPGRRADPSRRRFETMLIRSHEDLRSKSRDHAGGCGVAAPAPAPAR